MNLSELKSELLADPNVKAEYDRLTPQDQSADQTS